MAASRSAVWREFHPGALLGLPWRAHGFSMQWFVGVVYLIAALTSIGSMGLLPDNAHRSHATTAAILLAPVLAWFWFYLMPCSLRLVLSARSMCLPHAAAHAQRSLGLHVLLTVLVPALLLGLWGASVPTLVLSYLAVAAASLLLALLPGYLSLALLLAIVAIRIWAANWVFWVLDWPAGAGWAALACVLVAALMALACWRWRVLSRGGIFAARGWRPAICEFFKNLGEDPKTTTFLPAGALTASRPWSTLEKHANLAAVGPQHLGASLGMALGANSMPTRGWQRAWRLACVPLLVLGAALAGWLLLGLSDKFDSSNALAQLLLPILAGGFAVALLSVQALYRFCGRVNAELPLLALLPHLGPAQRVKRYWMGLELRRVLVRMLAIPVLLVVFLYAGLGAVPAALVYMLGGVAVFGALLGSCAIVAIMGQRHLSCGHLIGFALYWFLVLIASSVFAGIATGAGKDVPGVALAVLVLFWAAPFVPIGWTVVRGWRVWRQLPHAFLARTR